MSALDTGFPWLARCCPVGEETSKEALGGHNLLRGVDYTYDVLRGVDHIYSLHRGVQYTAAFRLSRLETY